MTSKRYFLVGITLVVTCMLLLMFIRSPKDDYSYQQIVQGLQERNRRIESVTMDYTKTSSFPDGRENILPVKYRYVYKGNKVYMRRERNSRPGKLVEEASFNGSFYNWIQHYTQNATITFIPNWPDSIIELVQIGPDDTDIGRWFAKKQGTLLGTTFIAGYKAYGITDGEKDQPGWSYSYNIWVVPELGFTPVKIEEYIGGIAKSLIEFHGLTPSSSNNILFSPRHITMWVLNLDDKIKSFDPHNPQGKWICINVDIKNIVYNIEYPDSFFDINIPEGYTVTDQITPLLQKLNASKGRPTERNRKREPIYDPNCNAEKQIANALVKAKRDNKHVLLMCGGNWCGWCYKLHDCFNENDNIKRLLQYEYKLVMIDINSNKDIPGRFNANPDGYPYLTVLNSDGEVIVNQSTVPLEEGRAHNPQKVYAFLTKWKPKPLDANVVYEKALALAVKENKIVFLHFGAPWCGWCHRLEDFLARPEIVKTMAQDYVLVKIDLDRMAGAKAIDKRIRQGKGGGIPWFAILDAKCKLLITSVGSQGNIGYPVKPTEIAHFIRMINETSRNITSEQISTIEKALSQEQKN